MNVLLAVTWTALHTFVCTVSRLTFLLKCLPNQTEKQIIIKWLKFRVTFKHCRHKDWFHFKLLYATIYPLRVFNLRITFKGFVFNVLKLKLFYSLGVLILCVLFAICFFIVLCVFVCCFIVFCIKPSFWALN